MNYFKFFATSSTTTFTVLKASTMSALPWWKRISRKSPANLLIQKWPSSKSSSTALSTTTTTRKTTTTSRPTTSTLRSIARSPTTPLTTSTTTTRRRNIGVYQIVIPQKNRYTTTNYYQYSICHLPYSPELIDGVGFFILRFVLAIHHLSQLLTRITQIWHKM